ncbi:MAG: HD domain-containing protein [Solirubrobacteraceae bacterium]
MGVVLGIPASVQGLPKTQAALDYARDLHAGQSREVDGAPFIVHPREVAELLYTAGAPDDVIAAGALHDVIEKTPAGSSDLRRRFGSRVAGLVLAVSVDERIRGYAARKVALSDRVADAGEEALMLFAADKISKARELRLLDDGLPGGGRPHPGDASPAWRLAHYRRCLALLRERLPDSPLVRQLDFELRDLSPGAL